MNAGGLRPRRTPLTPAYATASARSRRSASREGGRSLAGTPQPRAAHAAHSRGSFAQIASFLAVAFLAGTAACTSGPPAPVVPAGDVLQWRADKDVMFKTSESSPLLPEAKATFTGLSYWPIDPAYRVPASLKRDRSGPPMVIQLETSTNQMRRMEKVGTLGFTLKQATYQLTAFADLDAGDVNRLFVPFGDLTNKQETYGGGRYIELDRTASGLYDLDFNRAYHPFCVFNISYDCPVPPRENRLQVSIPVGERLSGPAK